MQRSNNKVRQWMVANGYHDIYFFPHSRFSKDYHLLGEDFDGLAAHENRMVLFQVKSNCQATKQKIKDYELLAATFGIEVVWFNAVDRVGLYYNNILTSP